MWKGESRHVGLQQTHTGFLRASQQPPAHPCWRVCHQPWPRASRATALTRQLGRKGRALEEFVTSVTAIHFQFLQTGQVWSEGRHNGGAAELASKAAEAPQQCPALLIPALLPTWPGSPESPGHHVPLPKVEPQGPAQGAPRGTASSRGKGQLMKASAHQKVN